VAYKSKGYKEPTNPVGNVAELFAGVGGFRIGLARAGWKTTFSNQWEPATKVQHASAVYVAQFGEDGHTNVDLANVKALPRNIDLLVGGFPCQDYSVAKTLNSSKGLKGKKGVLWWEILRLVKGKKPKFIFLENVDRLLKSPSNQRGRDFAVMLKTLGDEDRLGVVAFSHQGTVVLELTSMTEAGKRLAESRLESLDADGGTALWLGLKAGLDVLSARSGSTSSNAVINNTALLLLTDGEPSDKDHLQHLRSYCETNGGKYPGMISTFGFGYSLNSALLLDLAMEGGGMYAFIPDAGFVGTAFVNALSNILVTVACEASLVLEPSEGARCVCVCVCAKGTQLFFNMSSIFDFSLFSSLLVLSVSLMAMALSAFLHI
jgi:hypothetical protein